MTTDTTRKARQQATKVAADRGAPTKPSDPPKGDRVSPVWPDVSGGRYVPVEVDEIVLDDGPAEKKAAIAAGATPPVPGAPRATTPVPWPRSTR
jgi:hypothetical protein